MKTLQNLLPIFGLAAVLTGSIVCAGNRTCQSCGFSAAGLNQFVSQANPVLMAALNDSKVDDAKKEKDKDTSDCCSDGECDIKGKSGAKKESPKRDTSKDAPVKRPGAK